jgi:hypothetical protein
MAARVTKCPQGAGKVLEVVGEAAFSPEPACKHRRLPAGGIATVRGETPGDKEE